MIRVEIEEGAALGDVGGCVPVQGDGTVQRVDGPALR